MENKYLVLVSVQKVDGLGKCKIEDFEYTFEEGTLLEKRRNAINKAKEMITFFEHEIPKEQGFSSFSEAEAKGFKNYNSYSIVIYLIKDEEYDYAIYGDEELTFEALEVEAKYFIEMNEAIDLIEIVTPEDEAIQVLNEDINFFLASL